MKSLIAIIALSIFSSVGFCNTSVGGGGWKMQASTIGNTPVVQVNPKIPAVTDFVKIISRDGDGRVIFKYKPAGVGRVEVHQIKASDLSEDYLEAIKKSYASHQWEPVVFEVSELPPIE